MTFKDTTKDISLNQAINYHEKLGLASIITDGKDVTFEIEEEPTSLPAK